MYKYRIDQRNSLIATDADRLWSVSIRRTSPGRAYTYGAFSTGTGTRFDIYEPNNINILHRVVLDKS